MPKESQKPVYLFHGENTFLSNQKVQFWKDSFLKKYGEESNIEYFEEKKLNLSNFETNLKTLPFLCEKKLIIIKNFLSSSNKEDHKRIAQSLEETPDFCIVVFHETKSFEKTSSLYKKIKSIGKIEEFSPLSPSEMANFITKTAKEKNILISIANANHLAMQCGFEIYKCINELEKLSIFNNNLEITKQIIDDFVTPSLSTTIFKLTDALADKKAKESIKTLSTLIESGEELTKIFFMIVRHFRILIQVFDMYKKGENQISITKRLKQHPFVIQKTMSQSKNFTFEKLKTIYQTLLKIDTDFKTGKIKIYQGDDREYKLAIEKLILDCCSKN
jgi:DNA polymerase III subunit delta